MASEKREDSNLAKNMLEFAKIETEGNYYMYYGSLHCQLKAVWFAGRLNKSAEFGNQVCSFTSQYRDSEFLFFKRTLDSKSWIYEKKNQENFGIIEAGGYVYTSFSLSSLIQLTPKTPF